MIVYITIVLVVAVHIGLFYNGGWACDAIRRRRAPTAAQTAGSTPVLAGPVPQNAAPWAA